VTVPEKALYLEGAVLIDIRVTVFRCIIQHTKVNARNFVDVKVIFFAPERLS
jgi:hypothetical protein